VTKDPKTYTHDELVEVLQRSIALSEAAKDRPYTDADLVAAAKELDVEPEMVRKAQAELERRRAARSLAPRPFDTRIELETSDLRFYLRIPPVRPSVATLAPLGFAAFWLSFVAFWTTMAARGSALFAAFSIPFWLVGLGMVRRFAFRLFQSTTIELGTEKGSLETRPFGGKNRLQTKELRARMQEKIRAKSENDRSQEAAIVLEHGTKTFTLLESFSDQEQRWVYEQLRAWLPVMGDEGNP
jgi:hypothetical protein